jgi:DNA invertase Pin-like site-specific DNA recombinase
MKVVTYYRVSTDAQGQSGLGLEAQRVAVHQLAASRQWLIKDEVTEVESGTDNARPQLQHALNLCRNTNATLLVAKLDRLSRDATFLLNLADSRVPIVFGDMPELDATTSAGRLQLVMMAGFAEFERKRISERTKAALQQAKANGKQLGGARGDAAGRAAKYAAPAAAKARVVKADERAMQLGQTIAHVRIQNPGLTLKELAAKLNEMGVSTPSGKGQWSDAQVIRVNQRMEKINAGK